MPDHPVGEFGRIMVDDEASQSTAQHFFPREVREQEATITMEYTANSGPPVPVALALGGGWILRRGRNQ